MEGRRPDRPTTTSPADGPSWRLAGGVVRVVVHSVAMTLDSSDPAEVVYRVLDALVADDPFGRLHGLGAQMNPDAAVGAALGPAVVVSEGNLVRVIAAGPCDHHGPPAGTARPLVTRAPCGCLQAGTVRFRPVTVLVTTTTELRARPATVQLPDPPR